MNISYLDKTGLNEVWEKAKDSFADKVNVENELSKKIELPSGGSEGDYLIKTSSGVGWGSGSSSSDPSEGYMGAYISGKLSSYRSDYRTYATYTSDMNYGISMSTQGTSGSQQVSTYPYARFTFSSTGLYQIKTVVTDNNTNATFGSRINGGTDTHCGIRTITFPGDTLPTPLHHTNPSTDKQTTNEFIFAVNNVSETLSLMLIPYYDTQISATFEIKKLENLGGADLYFKGRYMAQTSRNGLQEAFFGTTYRVDIASTNIYNHIISNGITSSLSDSILTLTLPVNYLYKININFSCESLTDSDNDSQWDIGVQFPYGTLTDIKLNTTNSNSIYEWWSNKGLDLTFNFDEVRTIEQNRLLKVQLKPLVYSGLHTKYCNVDVQSIEKF